MTGNKKVRKEVDWTARQKLIRALIFLTPILVYLPTFGGSVALPPGQGTFSDLLITHYPNLLYLRDSIITHGQIPLWSNMIYSGTPFAANPLAGVFYLPGWIAMLFPLPAGLSLVLAGHLVFGTWGMYRFLRLENVNEAGSIFGALGFGLMPKLAAHFGAGHITLIYAISWTPWLLICSRGDNRGWKTGLVAAFLFLADPRWSVYAGILWLSYDIAHRQISGMNRVKIYLRSSLVAILVSAPLLLPMMEFVRQATRAALTTGDILQGSLPPGQLIGLLIPGSSGNIEWYSYLGGTSAALFVTFLFTKELRIKNRYWVAWFCLSILLSLGTMGLELEGLSSIPVLNLIRVPARSLFVAGIALAVISGKALDHIGNGSNPGHSGRNVKFGIFALGLSMVIGLAFLTGIKTLMLFWGFLFFSICGLVLFGGDRIIKQKNLIWIITVMLMVDVIAAGLASYELRPENLQERGNIESYLTREKGYFRIYSPSYSVEQHFSAEKGLEIADGIDPMQIAAYAEFMSKATGVESIGYSVTIPPFRSGDPELDNQDAIPDLELLALINAKYIVSAFEIDIPDLTPVMIEESTSLYLNEKVLPRAWVENLNSDPGYADPLSIGLAKITEMSPNRVNLEAAGPGKLVLSEITYPGWQVFVDGERSNIEPSHKILRSVILPEGAHEIEFKFQPLTVYCGLILAVIGWFLLGISKFWEKS